MRGKPGTAQFQSVVVRENRKKINKILKPIKEKVMKKKMGGRK